MWAGSGDVIGVAIGNTNAYVAVNGQMVANADGHRNTAAMVSQDGDVGMAALQKWVRQPEKMLDRNDKEQSASFWEGLLGDLAETIKANSPQGLDKCLCNILIEPTDNRKQVEQIAQSIFKSVQVLTSENQLLLSKRCKPITKDPTTICILKLGATSCRFSKLFYDPETELCSSREPTKIVPIGGKACCQKIVEFASTEFKRRNRACQEGINARGKRKLLRGAAQAMQALSSSQQANLYVEAIWEGMDLNTKISRSRFEDMVRPLFSEILGAIGDFEGVNEVYLLGGASNIPLFQSMLKQKFPELTILEAESTLATAASLLNQKLPVEHAAKPTVSLKTTPCSITLGQDHCLIAKGAPLPLARHGALTLEYPDDVSSLKLALEAAGHGALTEPLTFDKCAEAVTKSARNPTGKAHQVYYFVAYGEQGGLQVNLSSSKNSYEFAF